MKQTVEEAAMNFANYESNNLDKLPFKVKVVVDYDNGLTRGFKAGAKWQAKQSPWISVEERLPEDSQEVLILMRYITPCTRAISYQIVQLTYLKAFGMEVFESRKEKILAWMPIPSFDDILNANRDVLERIKEKGD